MIKAIAVEDEELALKKLKSLIKTDKRVNLVGAFNRSDHALNFAKINKIDLAFLDIEMPGISGMELAKELIKIYPNINIIFVTAYDQYMFEALNTHVFGYLLKPYDKNDVKVQIDSLVLKLQASSVKANGQKISIKCLGSFDCTFPNGEKIKFKTAKAEELFALLVDAQGTLVSKEVLIDKLWQDVDFEKASNLFRVTCTYLRQSLSENGFSNILIRELDKYRIDTNLVNCDYFQFREDIKIMDIQRINKLINALKLYEGSYFNSMPYEWTASISAWVDSKYIETSLFVSQYYIENGNINDGNIGFKKAISFFPDNEVFNELLIKSYLDNGERINALTVFNNYKKYIMDEYEEEPSPRLQSYFD